MGNGTSDGINILHLMSNVLIVKELDVGMKGNERVNKKER